MSIRRVIDIAAGVTAGVLLVISCSDDSPPRADAATCECPAAEPPLAGRIITVKETQSIPAPNPPTESGRQNSGARCPVGGVVLTGGCESPASFEIVLERAFPTDANAWVCGWKNPNAFAVTVATIVKCLMPAS